MKLAILFFLSLITFSYSAMASADLPNCTLAATPENRLPADIHLEVTPNSDRWSRAPYLLNFYERQLPAQLSTISDRSRMETVVGFFGRRLHPRVKSIDAYVHSMDKLEVILYELKSERNFGMSKLLLINGIGGPCK